MTDLDIGKVLADVSHPTYAAGIGLCLWRIVSLERRIDAVMRHFSVPAPRKRRWRDAGAILCIVLLAVTACGCGTAFRVAVDSGGNFVIGVEGKLPVSTNAPAK